MVMGKIHFTEYELPIILPYAFLTALPGFDFLRTPGRFMLVGFVGFCRHSCLWSGLAYPKRA